MDKSLLRYIRNVKETHARKLFSLGAFHTIPTLDPHKVVMNFSNYQLSVKEKNCLAFGLNHCLHPKFSKLKYFSAFEMLYNRVKDLPLYVSNRENFRKCIKNLAYKIMYKSKKEKVKTSFPKKKLQF